MSVVYNDKYMTMLSAKFEEQKLSKDKTTAPLLLFLEHQMYA